ncbi:alpha/beta fold hydrolase [Curtobacterium sp. YC1]|uniref:alpha/beta fold hydrolase n=1 Tax=Curtobacterium sp. YC1 TaxID=2795488 RepID=UPI0018E5200F|nr:alpha/beta fold hydrolase [Curtobacterium sp. YC1]QQD76255.1 alpha/beta fold hydrolase [Curtobacterium sp. YC1]
MKLHVEVQGQGERTALLLHGMTGSRESWWRVVPLLVASGHRVLAIDLPGHGRSPRDDTMTVERAARSITESTADECGPMPDLVMGHSYGGLLLAAAVDAGVLTPKLSVYIDTPFTTRGGWDRAELTAAYEQDRRSRTVDGLRASRPFYSDQDCVVEARAAECFDPATAAAQATGPGVSFQPEPGSIILRAEPSSYVDDETAALHSGRGVIVRDVPGAAHSVWYSHFDEFVAALPEVFT